MFVATQILLYPYSKRYLIPQMVHLDIREERKKELEHFDKKEIYSLADKVVYSFYAKQKIPFKEKDDIRQEVLAKYLNKEEGIIKAYTGDSKVSTYLYAIFYRMTCEVIRSQQKNWHLHEPGEAHSEQITPDVFSSRPDEELILKSEANYLKLILLMLALEGKKLSILLRILYGLDIGKAEKKGFENIAPGKWENITEKSKSKSAAYEKMAEFVNATEQKNIGADAVRVWLYQRIEHIINILNQRRNAQYNRETFQLLFEYAVTKELL